MNQGLQSYNYIAISDAGVRVSSTMQAESEGDVITALHRAGYTPVQVRPVRALGRSMTTQGLWEMLNAHEPRFKTQELSAFTRQLHQMLKAGIPISTALTTLAEDQPDEVVGDMLRNVADRITGGASLTQAFDGYPKAFDGIFLAYASAAEESGDLVEVTARLAQIIDKRAEIQRKIKGVTMYPALVSVAVLSMLFGIILFIVPRFTDIYASFDSQLPAPTRALVSASKVLPLVLVVVGALIASFVVWNRKQVDNFEFGRRYDQVKFHFPILGKMFHKLALMRFCSTMGGAKTAGVQSFEALDLAGRASGSRWVRSLIKEMQDSTRSGVPMSVVMNEHPDLFPSNVRKMVSTGEETGELAQMLNSSGAALEDEIDVLIATMSAKLEVALLLFMGFSVGGVLIALYLPILSFTSTVSKGYGF